MRVLIKSAIVQSDQIEEILIISGLTLMRFNNRFISVPIIKADNFNYFL